MDDDNMGLLIVGGVVLYLAATGKLSGLFGGDKENQGKPPIQKKAPSAEDRNASAISGALCGGVAGALGGPTAGAAAGGFCASVGADTWKGLKWAAGNPTKALGPLALGPLWPAIGGGKQMTYQESEKFKTDIKAKGGTPPTGCGGWKGPCAPPPPAAAPPPPPKPPTLAVGGGRFTLGKPAGFR